MIFKETARWWLIQIFLLSIGTGFILPNQLTVQAQVDYQLVIEGNVQNERGIPDVFKVVRLTTTAAEVLETKTDIDGNFRLEGVVRGDSGTLEVIWGSLIVGQVNPTWGADGPGAKTLTLNLITNGRDLWLEGDQRLPATITPRPSGEDMLSTQATPIPMTTPTVPSPTSSDTSTSQLGTALVVIIALVSVGGLIGILLLIGGGLFLLFRMRRK